MSQRALTPVKSESVWFEDVELPSFPTLTQERATDVVIIGGGITGTSAAYYLARAGVPCILIEANRVGQGATGRSSGILSTIPEFSLQPFLLGKAKEIVRQYLALSKTAINLIQTAIEKESIECHLERREEWGVALEPSKIEDLSEIYEEKITAGLPTRYFDGTDAQKNFSFPVYAAIANECATLHPMKLLVGLANAAAAHGAQIFEGTMMQGIEEKSDQILVKTNGGTISAKHLLVATEAYNLTLPRFPAFQILKKYLIPTTVFQIATAPLSQEKLKELSWEDRKIIWTDYGLYNDLRLTPDNRFLFGGEEIEFLGSPNIHDPHTSHFSHLEKTLRTLFPQLTDIPITHRWQGTLGFSIDSFPIIGPLSNQIFISGGYGGHGLTYGHLGGFLFAEHVLESKSVPAASIFLPSRKIYEEGFPVPRPLMFAFLNSPYFLRTAVLRMYMRTLHFFDRLDRIMKR